MAGSTHEEDVTNNPNQAANNLNLFYTRCHVQGKVCSLMIDERSCANVASEYMVKKLGLKVKKHPWLDEKYNLRVDSKVMVPITIGKYEDEILCDVLPLDSCHLLLGRPWKSDRKATYDGFTNRYSFRFNRKKMALVPIAPQEVYQDQLILKQRVKQFVSESLNPPHQKEKVLVTDSKETPTSLTNIAPELPSPSESSSLLQESKDTVDGPGKSPPICEEESPTETHGSSSLISNLEQPTHFVQEPVLMPFPCDYPRKHCKEIDLVRNAPNLFMLVSAQDEKCFGLENVKEFRVSKPVFNKMIPSFETFAPEQFFKPNELLFDKFRDYNSSLSMSLYSNAFELFRTKTECALVRTWSDWNEHVLHESPVLNKGCKPTVNCHTFKFSTSKIMHLFCSMSVEKGTGTRKKHKCLGEFAIKEKPPDHEHGQVVKDSSMIQEEPPDPTTIALMIISDKHIQILIQISNSLIQFVSHVSETAIVSSLYPGNVVKKLGLLIDYLEQNSYLRRKEHERNNILIQAETCLSVYSNSMTVIMCFFFAKGVEVITGFVAGLKRPRRTTRREEDKRFKPPDLGKDKHQDISSYILIKEEPPDLDQDIHQDISSFNLIKEAPPDATYKPKPNLNIQGKYNSNSSFKVTDLASLCAGKTDLRSNPFQVGEDDMILTSKETKENKEIKEQLEPELNGSKEGYLEQLEAVETKEEEEALQVPSGPMTRARIKKFQEALTTLLLQVQGNLKCANPTTLVVIQAT